MRSLSKYFRMVLLCGGLLLVFASPSIAVGRMGGIIAVAKDRDWDIKVFAIDTKL